MRYTSLVTLQGEIKKEISTQKIFNPALYSHTALAPIVAIMLTTGSAALAPSPAHSADLDPVTEEPAPTVFPDTLINAFKDGKILLNTRLRYEHVDQDSIANSADALTFRARFGFETADFHGFKLLTEGDFTRDLGVDDFNSTTNGLGGIFPVVADPDSTRLNRLHLSYQGIVPDTKFILGRQRIKLVNDRFVGNVGFRQNEQTYDAIRVQNTSIENLTLDYSYVNQVNRIFGSESFQGNEGTNSHFLNATYALPFGKVTGYGYFLDFEDQLVNASSANFGGRIDLKHKLNQDWSVGLVGEFANQNDFADAANDFDNNYYLIQGTANWRGFSFKAAYEVLEGDGTTGFSTPLATLHAFQGDADVFLATPADGIEDLQFALGYKVKDLPYLGDTRIKAVYHRFTSENTSGDLGDEFDFGIYTKPLKEFSASVEYANFQSDTPAISDIQRLFLTLGFKL
ncbi:MAG: hypothetical protein ABJM86_00680 [Hyphomicrobiales bacterium]